MHYTVVVSVEVSGGVCPLRTQVRQDQAGPDRLGDDNGKGKGLSLGVF